MVNVGNAENPTYLPADVCVVLPGQVARAKLTGVQTSEMIKFAVRKPYQNAQSITSSGQRTLGLSSQNATLVSSLFSISLTIIFCASRTPLELVRSEFLVWLIVLTQSKAKFGISVSQRIVTVPGRILASPTVRYLGKGGKTPTAGSWNMQDIKFRTGATLKL